MARTYLELVEGTSSKFWEIVVDGADHTVRYGKIGTDGRESTKSFDSDEEAQAQAEKLIRSKRKKGYAEPTVEGELVDVDTLRETYPVLEQVDWLLDFVESGTLYKGNVTSGDEGLMDLALEQGDEGTLVIIDGDLTITANNAGWGDRAEFSNDGVLVTGNLTVNNLQLSEIGAVIVQGTMRAKNILVCYGDDGGSLDIGGDLIADVVIASTYFVVDVAGEVKVGHIIGDSTYATDFAKGKEIISLYDEANVFIDELSDDGEVEEWELYEKLTAGEEVFVNGGKPREGSYEKEW